MRNKWGPLRIHRMTWKVRFQELTSWRQNNDQERTTNDEERLKIFTKSPTEILLKRYRSASAWIFFMETIFLTNFKWLRSTRRAQPLSPSLLPLFIGKYGPSRGTSWKAQEGLVAICTPFLLNTPLLLFFGDSFSVTLRNITNFVTILVFFS